MLASSLRLNFLTSFKMNLFAHEISMSKETF